jgi:hypothetical protein
MVSSPAKNFTVGQSLNHRFGSLNTDLEWRTPFVSGDEFRVKSSYDWKDKGLDSLSLRYGAAGDGVFALTYDFGKPKVMLTYTWD